MLGVRTVALLRALLFLVVGGLAGGLVGGCTATTESTQVGVRVVHVGLFGPRGVEPEIYAPGGTYFFFRPLSDWYLLDTALQNLVMTRDPAEGDRTGDDSLRFKTIDGNDVSVNVTIAWRVLPEKAPQLVQHVGTSVDAIEEKLVRPVSRAVVRDVLNQLSSEAYYQAELRYEMAEEAKARLVAILEPEGIAIDNVLLGEHKFNDKYEQIIRDKKVAEQEAERLVSEKDAAGEAAKRDLERAKGEVSKTIEAALGKARQRQLEADAIFFEREQQAAAILSEKRARAEGLRKQAQALAGAGGERMVKLAIARALQGKPIVFMPAGGGMDVRTTDVNTLLQRFGVHAISAPEGKK